MDFVSEEEKINELIKALDEGKRLVVEINKADNVDYLEKGMRAELTDLESEEYPNNEIVYIAKMNLKGFLEYNENIEKPIYYDEYDESKLLTATEAKLSPRQTGEYVVHLYFSLDDGPIPFSVVLDRHDKIYRKYLELNSELSYINWLEDIVASSLED